MADNTSIEWADDTRNAINGCSVVSPGCTNCYAMRWAGTRLKHHPSRQGLTQDSKAGPVWNGEVRLNERELLAPLRQKRPRRIFWNAHGDLFHENVPDEWIDRLFAVCALTPHHTHMILTKRSARMREYAASPAAPHRIARAIVDMLVADPKGMARFVVAGRWPVRTIGEVEDPDNITIEWPLPNVWLGVSVEDQTRADERIPDLLATPAAVRFLSCEPLLGPVDLRPWLPDCYECGASCGLRLAGPPEIERCTECGEECGPDTEPVFSEGCPKCAGELEFICPACGHYMVYQHPDTPNLDWVIAGGESGPNARPMHTDWARSLRDQCEAAGVAFHFKQWGEWGCIHMGEPGDEGKMVEAAPGTPPIPMVRMGKKRAGRLLDGVEHNGMPSP